MPGVQNKYVGDIGDFCKLGLLRWLSGMHPETSSTKFSLGVGWYAVPDDFDPPANRDGRHISYLGLGHDKGDNIIQTPGTKLLKHLDTDLWDKLKDAVGDNKIDRRHISTLEAILGTKGSCEFHRATLPTTLDWRERPKLRQEWAGGMVECLQNRDLLFLDPDNALASKLVKKKRKEIGQIRPARGT